MRGAQGPTDAQTVPVHVQIVDIEPKTIDIILPDYLPVSDLTQRVARDAKLGAYWPDGSRRTFYLRARGRLMQPEERLKDLGIVPYELLHMLPEPPPDSGVAERAPEYPANQGYEGIGVANIAVGFAALCLWTLGWSLALTVDQGVIIGIVPAVGLSLICTSFARHLWGGLGSSPRVPALGVALFFLFYLLAAMMPLVTADIESLAFALLPALVAGPIGVMVGWLAWYGAVEPLPKVTRREVETAVANVTFPCGICSGDVTQDVKADCVYGCGRVFHAGCYEAKRALSGGAGCAVCGYVPA